LGLTDAEWLLFGIGLGSLATAVSALVWTVYGKRRR
jgi:hypothetical protein